jgi:hypothetical protein
MEVAKVGLGLSAAENPMGMPTAVGALIGS